MREGSITLLYIMTFRPNYNEIFRTTAYMPYDEYNQFIQTYL